MAVNKQVKVPSVRTPLWSNGCLAWPGHVTLPRDSDPVSVALCSHWEWNQAPGYYSSRSPVATSSQDSCSLGT